MFDLTFLREADSLLILGVVILAGVTGGSLAKRAGLPRVTGQILAGILIGHPVLDLFDQHDVEALGPVTIFALGLMTFTIGTHLNVRRLRNAGKRLGLLLLTEATLMPLVVLGFLLPYGLGLEQASLYAALAISTAPATVVALVKETRARGVFVKTLFAAVALNNLACVFLFEVARAVTKAGLEEGDLTVTDVLVGPGLQLLVALAIGGSLALLMHYLTRFLLGDQRRATASVLSLLLCLGTAQLAGVSPLFACMFLGFVQGNITAERSELVDSVFKVFEPAILAIFFTLAGMHLDFGHIEQAGVLALLVLVARLIGKLLAANVAMKLAGATDAVRRNLGPALVPQAGVAVGLVVLVQEDPALAFMADTFATAVLTVVTVNEIIGPILARRALQRSGEAGMDRMRLIDFIGEENIVTGLDAATPAEAIEHLVEVLVRSHQLPRAVREPLLASVIEREDQVSTVLGGGLMIPHGVLEHGDRMLGVMGLSEQGLDFDSPDGEPVHCVVLLATPAGQRDRHLEVLAALARSIGTTPDFARSLFASASPAHAYDLLHGEGMQAYNYFLDEEGAAERPAG